MTILKLVVQKVYILRHWNFMLTGFYFLKYRYWKLMK